MQFIIPRGQDFYCEFTIKEPGSGTPMDLTGATGTFSLSDIGVNACMVLEPVALSFPDAINGIAAVNLTSAQTEPLIGRRGFAEDGYPMIPTYRASLDIQTIDNPVYVEIPQVYISDDGTSCLAQS